MRRLGTVWALALCAVLVAAPAALAAPASSPALSPAASAPVYVALGDSYSAGVGTRVTNPFSGACRRSPLAYPPLFARIQRKALTFLACSGATTADVRNTQIPAMPTDASLVTITVGGNDAWFAAVLRACMGNPVVQSTCDTALAGARDSVQRNLPASLTLTFAAIHLRAPNARLVVLGYPHLFGSGPCTAPGLPPAVDRAAIDDGTDTVDDIIAERATAANATFVDVRARFQTHGACAANFHRWINPPTLPPTDSYHPDIRGHGLGYLGALLGAGA